MAEPIAKEDAHDGGGKCRGGRVSDRFHTSKAAHAACANKVRVRPLEAGMLPCDVCVKMDYQERRLDWKIVDKFGRFCATGVGEGATWARRTHALDIAKHSWPVKAKTEAMQGAIRVEVAANGIRVKRNKQYIPWSTT